MVIIYYFRCFILVNSFVKPFKLSNNIEVMIFEMVVIEILVNKIVVIEIEVIEIEVIIFTTLLRPRFLNS